MLDFEIPYWIRQLNPFFDYSYAKEAYYAVKYFFQKLFRKSHCSDKDFFSLDLHLATIIHKKLKAFREFDPGSYPSELDSYETWMNYLDKMIMAMEYVKVKWSDDSKIAKFGKKWGINPFDTPLIEKEVQNGLELFGKYFKHLWS